MIIIQDGNRHLIKLEDNIATVPLNIQIIDLTEGKTPTDGLYIVDAYREYEDIAAFIICHDNGPISKELEDKIVLEAIIKSGKKAYIDALSDEFSKKNYNGRFFIKLFKKLPPNQLRGRNDIGGYLYDGGSL